MGKYLSPNCKMKDFTIYCAALNRQNPILYEKKPGPYRYCLFYFMLFYYLLSQEPGNPGNPGSIHFYFVLVDRQHDRK